MKPNALLKRSVDVVMYVLLLILMGQCMLRGAVHEWLGIAVGVLLLVCILLHSGCAAGKLHRAN